MDLKKICPIGKDQTEEYGNEPNICNYLSGPIVAQDEFEMMSPSNGFSLLGRKKKLGCSLSTLETTCYVLLYLKKEILFDQVKIHDDVPFA